ncbi:hypothetical protein VSR68_23965 [Paraburkholderia phymatum]|uniref:hypothetical protein n=1 Tax=Paraburkholderia phymatum TaxID=148447 RepID=UPI003174234D
MEKMSFQQLEVLYDAMARSLDRVPESRRNVYLARLVLQIAHELGHADRIVALVESSADEVLREGALS